jgi:hypothetical protein
MIERRKVGRMEEWKIGRWVDWFEVGIDMVWREL